MLRNSVRHFPPLSTRYCPSRFTTYSIFYDSLRLAVKNKCDRAVIFQCHDHVGTELACLHVNPTFSNGVRHGFIESPRGIGRRGGIESRTPATMGIAQQRKLRDNQQFSLDLHDRPVHLARLVGKDAEVRYLVGHIGDVRLGITFRHP